MGYVRVVQSALCRWGMIVDENRIRLAAETYFALLNADRARFFAQFALNAKVEDVEGNSYRGTDAITAYVEQALSTFERVDFCPRRITVATDQAAVRWSAQGVLCTGERVTFSGITVLRFDADYRVVSAREYHAYSSALARTA